MPHLFEPLTLRSLVLKNRIGIPPMCQYSASEGKAGPWHDIHYGSRVIGGAGMLIVEATAVEACGRISPGDLGLWSDDQIEPLARIARFAEAHGCAPVIQLAHAGRKGSAGLGWEAQRTLTPEEGGWLTVGPSAIPFGEGYLPPQVLDTAGIAGIVQAFAEAARRALEAGFKAVEIHAAHGYLLHEFLSPLANQRSDAYGGSFEHRTRLVREVVEAIRGVWPDNLPLLIRLSATDWHEGGWTPEETVALCRQLKTLGVDLADMSTAGMLPTAPIPIGPGFQTEFAARVRQEAGLASAAVGLITSPHQADHIVRTGQADLVLIGREALRDPYWPLHAAQALNQPVDWPVQYLRAAPANARRK